MEIIFGLLFIFISIFSYWIGKSIGWKLRDNLEKERELERERIGLVRLQEELNRTLMNSWQNMNIFPMDLEVPLTLEEQLDEAIEVEDYEKAAIIQNIINNIEKPKDI
jgi:hypothetical protein